MNKSFFLILFLIELSSVFSADKAITIFIAGDSTAANKDTSGGKLERGWGQLFQNYFNKNFVVVDNHAVNGRSSKSFIDGGQWAKVTKLIKKGDYVLIQFGHNDEKENADPHAITFVLKNDNIINSKEYLQTNYNVGKLNLQESNHAC